MSNKKSYNDVKHPRKKVYYENNQDKVIEKVKAYQKENEEIVKESRKKTYNNMVEAQKLWNRRCKFYRLNLANFLVKRNFKGLWRAISKLDNTLAQDEKLRAILFMFCDKKEDTKSFTIKNGEDVMIEVLDGELVFLDYTERMKYKKGASKKSDFYNECVFVQDIFKQKKKQEKGK